MHPRGGREGARRTAIHRLGDAFTARGQLHAAQSREQKLRAENENEANELRHTIRTLRSELEATPVKGTAAVETELAAFVAERRNLQNQIWAMRATLDVRV